MSTNEVRQLRSARQFSQRKLAEIAGTTQQTIQRIESGTQSVKFDLAVRICKALGCTIEQAFPASKSALAKAARSGKHLARAMMDDKDFQADMDQAGIDVDPRVWFFKFRLRGGVTGIHKVSTAEQKRLFSRVQDDQGLAYYHNDKHAVLINLEHLVYCHFLFEPGYIAEAMEEAEESREEQFHVRVYTCDTAEPITLDVDPDYSDDEEDEGQLHHLLSDAELFDSAVMHLVDVDGEEAFFRRNHVSMVEVPLSLLTPQDDDDEVDEEQETSDSGETEEMRRREGKQ